ncbi:unnamed protein product [Tenebrio molitor]|nr:unnamed protein product [Tenebrio molitor]
MLVQQLFYFFDSPFQSKHVDLALFVDSDRFFTSGLLLRFPSFFIPSV